MLISCEKQNKTKQQQPVRKMREPAALTQGGTDIYFGWVFYAIRNNCEKLPKGFLSCPHTYLEITS